MKFKTKILQENLVTLSGIVNVLEKIGKTAAMYLTEEHLRLAVIVDNPDNPKVFCEIKQIELFQDYRIESQSDNTILFEIDLNNLSCALLSGKNAQVCNMKLVKRDSKPNLSIEIRALDALVVDITHDLPIKIVKPCDVYFYMPPDVPPPMVALELPRGRLIRTIVERMAKISKQVTIHSNMSGKLVIKSDASAVTVKTFFHSLVPYFAAVPDPQPTPVAGTPATAAAAAAAATADHTVGGSRRASVKVDVRKLSTVLQFQSLILWDRALLFSTSNETLVLHVYFTPANAGSLTFYIPTIIDLDYGHGDDE